MNHSESMAAVALPTSEIDKLEVALAAQLAGRITHLRLQLEDSGVILCGFARAFHAKQLAQHALMRLSNLPILSNEIEVF